MAILVGSAFIDSEKQQYLLTLISSMGSVFGGIAGIVAAVAAFLGVNTWKKQLKYGKHMSLIWSCMESLRNFQRRNMQWYILAHADCTGSKIPEETISVEKELLDNCINELDSYFNALDKIVVKNQWQWANYASTLQSTVSRFSIIFREYKDNPYGVTPLDQELQELNTILKKDTQFLDSELEKLESKYQ